MTTTKKLLVCVAITAALLAGWINYSFGGDVDAEKIGATKIINQPRNRIAERGTLVDFSVVITNGGPSATYQWQRNGNAIEGATNRTHCIQSVQVTDVGAYDVVVKGKGTVESTTVYLSVYTLTCTNSNMGTLVTPIGAFSNQTITNCGTFNRAFCPTNDYGLPALFYGPNASPQSGPFQNTTYAPTLTLDTFSADNGTADTGIMFQNNFVPINPPLCCNDNASGGTDPKQSKCGPITLSSNTGTSKNSYRVTILYKDPPGPPPSGTITFNWLYH